MAGQISRFTGNTPASTWFDMADAAAAQQAQDARTKVADALAQDQASLPSGATAAPPMGLFGPIAGRPPAPNRSGQRLAKSKVASAAEAASFRDKVAKTGQILLDMTGLGHITSGQYLTDAGQFGQLLTPGTGTGWDGYNTPAENDRKTDIAGAYGMDAVATMAGSSPFSRPANSLMAGLPLNPGEGKVLGKIGHSKPKGFGGNGGPSAEELLQQAVDTPRKVSSRGGYVGAPPHVNSPEAEAGVVSSILDRLKNYKGTGTTFYDDFQNAIRNWTGDPKMAQKFASASGHTSNQMSPLPNTTHALKAMNQDAVGYPVKAGLYPNASGLKITENFADGRMSADPKTGQYTNALLPPEMRPADFGDYAWGGERAVHGRAVHDTWDKEAFGYPRNPQGKHNAASDTEHLFMDRIYNKVVRAARRDPELRGRLGTGSTTYERAQADLWDIARQDADKFDVLPAPRLMSENSTLTQMAAIPGASTGVDPRLLNAPLDVKRRYTDDMFNAISDSTGGNVPARAVGMSPPMTEGFGPWGDQIEPNRNIRFGVGTVGSGAEKAVDPASMTSAQAMRDWNMLGLGQEGGALTAGRADGASRAKGNLAVVSGYRLDTPEEYHRSIDAVRGVFGPDWGNKVVPMPGKNGELVLKNVSDMPNPDFHNSVSQVHQALPDKYISGQGIERDVGNDYRYVQFDQPSRSPHVPEVWGQAPQFQNPTSYHRLMDETRTNPKLKATFDAKVLPSYGKVQQESERWAAEMGLPANTVPDRVREIMVKAGAAWPAAIDAAVKKGIIPAFALPMAYGAMRGQFAGEDGSK